MKIVALTVYGLESVVAKELRNLGYRILDSEDGRLFIEGNYEDLCFLNIMSRTVERFGIDMGKYEVKNFDQMFDVINNLKWEDYIRKDSKVIISKVRIRNSRNLKSARSIQKLIKKAIIERLKRIYKLRKFEEKGPKYDIRVYVVRNKIRLFLDSTGIGLNKRGYRIQHKEVALKETIAASILIESHWDQNSPLIDPFCGSGTIPIETALYALNIPPNINRKFLFEEWEIWNCKNIREKIKEKFKRKIVPKIYCCDIDDKALDIAKENAKRAGIFDYIIFENKDIKNLTPKFNNGYMITDPPYGRKSYKNEKVEHIYGYLHEFYNKHNKLYSYIITESKKFEKYFGERAKKIKRIYNGSTILWLYEYF